MVPSASFAPLDTTIIIMGGVFRSLRLVNALDPLE